MVLSIFRAKKFQKRVLLGLLIIIIPAFVLWGVGSMIDKEQPIGKIGGTKISKEDLEKSAQGMKVEIMLSYYSNYDLFSSIIKNRPMFNKMSWDRLIFLRAAKKHHIKISNKDLLFFLSRHPLFQRENGFSQQAYNYIVSNALKMEPHQFEECVRENLMISAFQKSIYGDLKFSDKELEDFFKARSGSMDLTMLVLDKNMVSSDYSPKEKEIRIFYHNNPEMFRSPAKIELEYMSIPYSDKDEKQKAIDKFNSLYNGLMEYPTTFQKTAESNGIKYKNTGLISNNSLIPGIKYSQYVYDVAFSMDKGEISPPLYTTDDKGEIYMFHKTKGVLPEDLSLDDSREQIIKKLVDAKNMELARKKAFELFDKISGESLSIEDAAGSLGKKTIELKKVTPEVYVPSIGKAAAIIESGATAQIGSVPKPLHYDNGYILFRVDAFTYPGKDVFAKEKEGLVRDLTLKTRKKKLEEWTETKAPKSELFRPLEQL